MATDSGRRCGAVQRPSACTPYERLVHDLEHDPKVAQEVALGKRIGFYRIKSQLGAGNFSRVKLGVQVLTNEKVAIKIIDKTKLDDASRRLLSREISCMECLDHPNVIRLFEVVENFQRLHLVMECTLEGDLHGKIVEMGPFSEENARRVYAQVVAAILHMHNKGVIHRDLKAENVLFVSEKLVKVADFGFSTQKTYGLETYCGSPPYAAPELFGSETYLGTMVDIWALGVLLYFMLSGNMPFLAENVPLLKDKILLGEYHMPKALTPDCKELIAGILVKDVGTRFTLDDICRSMWLTGSGEHNPSGAEAIRVLSTNFHTSNTVDTEISTWLERVGVPKEELVQVLGEPRNPIAGTYRILLHRKHLANLKEEGGAEDSVTPHVGRGRNYRSLQTTAGELDSCKARRGDTQPADSSAGGKRSSRFCTIL